MNVVHIIPTGIGASIGGHAGDGNPTAKLLGAVCDHLITHPNVVNASDINEMPENAWYVEGSILDRFLRGEITLKKPLSNKILLVANAPVRNETVNAASAAQMTIGADILIVELQTPLRLIGKITGKGATGDVWGWEELVVQVEGYDFDVLAIATRVEVERDVALKYFETGGINPWGGVEAKTSKLISSALDKPSVHAPIETDDVVVAEYNEIVDPRMAAEIISRCYLHSVLKGLHRAPRITEGGGLSVQDIDCLITPSGCVGPPHHACMEMGIPIIAVEENETCLNDPMPQSFIRVRNYLEAAGLVAAMRCGVHRHTVCKRGKSTAIITTI